MKYLLTILIVFTGCSTPPKFKVGDCTIIDGDVVKITDVGQYSYKLILTDGRGGIATFNELDEKHPKIDCFDRFNKDKQ